MALRSTKPVILIVHPSSGWGGAERTSVNIVKICREYHFPALLLSNQIRFRNSAGDNLYLDRNFQSWFGKTKRILNDLLRLYRLCRSLRPRIIIGMMPYGGFLASVITKFLPFECKSIASPRGSCKYFLKYFVKPSLEKAKYKFFFSLACGLADYFLSPSMASIKDYVSYFHVNLSKCFHIPNAVEVPKLNYDYLFDRRLSTFDSPELVWLGRFSEEKRLDLILESIKRLNCEKASLYMAGEDCAVKFRLKRIARDYGISDRIIFFGYQEDVYSFLMPRHIFVHACLFEEFGYALLEAMSVGLPVVSMDCPYGPREILDNGKYGILVKDYNEMASAIDSIAADKDFWLLLANRARERVRHYDFWTVGRCYYEMFSTISENF